MHYTSPIGSDGFYVNIKCINTVGAFAAVYIAFIICMQWRAGRGGRGAMAPPVKIF